MLDQLVELGYCSPWQERLRRGGSTATKPASSEPIECFGPILGVRLPPGTRLDPGGIGRPAADLATDLLVSHGATTTSVELGGDLRVSGQAWLPGGSVLPIRSTTIVKLPDSRSTRGPS
ncbi:MAG: hypothetical protein R2710_18735 [Acidimicrobiales bacterium]